MKKPALRNNRFKNRVFSETKWTKSSKSLGEYIFRRLSLDQSDKHLQRIRPRHLMSKLIVSSEEINKYVSDYLAMLEKERSNYLIDSKSKTSKNNSVYKTYLNPHVGIYQKN